MPAASRSDQLSFLRSLLEKLLSIPSFSSCSCALCGSSSLYGSMINEAPIVRIRPPGIVATCRVSRCAWGVGCRSHSIIGAPMCDVPSPEGAPY